MNNEFKKIMFSLGVDSNDLDQIISVSDNSEPGPAWRSIRLGHLMQQYGQQILQECLDLVENEQDHKALLFRFNLMQIEYLQDQVKQLDTEMQTLVAEIEALDGGPEAIKQYKDQLKP